MQPGEGSALIQTYLNRGASEQQSAELLSRSLGGLPLAIIHFAGYVARSQCPLSHILATLDSRMKSSQVWKSTHSLNDTSYRNTLNNVWDLAFNRLTKDAEKLLEFLAFLDPDQTPVEMFVGPGIAGCALHWQYWNVERKLDP